MEQPRSVGLKVSGFVCNLLLLHSKMEYKEAYQVSKVLDDRMKEVDWIETYDGTTFDKGYVPVYEPVAEERED